MTVVARLRQLRRDHARPPARRGRGGVGDCTGGGPRHGEGAAPAPGRLGPVVAVGESLGVLDGLVVERDGFRRALIRLQPSYVARGEALLLAGLVLTLDLMLDRP